MPLLLLQVLLLRPSGCLALQREEGAIGQSHVEFLSSLGWYPDGNIRVALDLS